MRIQLDLILPRLFFFFPYGLESVGLRSLRLHSANGSWRPDFGISVLDLAVDWPLTGLDYNIILTILNLFSLFFFFFLLFSPMVTPVKTAVMSAPSAPVQWLLSALWNNRPLALKVDSFSVSFECRWLKMHLSFSKSWTHFYCRLHWPHPTPTPTPDPLTCLHPHPPLVLTILPLVPL